jgi:hypothetical protein
MSDLGFSADRGARAFIAIGDAATPSVCGPLVASGAADDRTSRQLSDPGLERLTAQADFWNERVAGSGRFEEEGPYFEGEEESAEPLLRLFAENAVLQVLSDLAVAEDLLRERERELVAMGVLSGEAAVIPRDAWHVRSQLAARVEESVGGSLTEIAQRFQPASAVGAERLAHLKDLVASIQQVNVASAGGVHAAFAALLDCLSTRGDAWLVAEAEEALEQEHAAGRRGVSLGGWGVLEEVRPAASLPPTRHASAPSQELATTMGLIERARRGLAASGLDGSIRAELSGPRVSEARELLNLLRQGRAIDAALSRRVAEKLNLAGRGALMEALVAELPAEGGAVDGFDCDGLAFLERGSFSNIPDVDVSGEGLLDEIQKDLRAAMETLGELHLVEGAAALSQRRVEAAQANLDALSAGTPPPSDLSVLTPSSAGTTLDFTVAACIGASEQPNGAQDLRARLAPHLEALAERLLGPIQGALLIGSSAPVALTDLGLSALSLAYLAQPGSSGRDRLTDYARAARGLPDDEDVDLDQGAQSTLWAAERLGATLAEARGLQPTDFPEEADVRLDAQATAGARRVAENAMSDLRSTLPSVDTATPADAADLFAAGVISAPDVSLIADAADAIDARLGQATAADDDLSALAALWADMPVMPAMRSGDSRPWQDGPMLQGAARPELFVWLEETQAVRARLAPLADLMLGAEARPLPVQATQWPVRLRPSEHQQVDWIGAELREDDVYPSRSSFVTIGTEMSTVGPFAGLFIDAWQEVVPDETVTAGLVVGSPTPPARPPQLLVLAVPGGSGEDWTPQSLLETLKTTVAVSQLRTVALGTLPEETQANGPLGRLGQALPVGAIRPEDTALSRAACPPVVEG